MPHPPTSIRLSEQTYEILCAEGASHHRSVGQMIREFAEQGAAELRRAQIRAESAAAAARYHSDARARDFYDVIAAVGSEAIDASLPDERDSGK